MQIFTWKQRVIVLLTSTAVIGVFALVGYLIGRAVNNVALLVFLAVIVSYPFTLWALARAMHRDYERRAKKEQQQ